MSRLSRIAACAAAAVVMTLVPSSAAQAYVASPSGATADTTLVCQRLWGSYVLSVRGSGFHYARMYLTNSYTGPLGWTGWTSQFWGNSSAIPLPRMGSMAVYFQYAYWNGSTWELAGEWAKVYNARGEHAGYWC